MSDVSTSEQSVVTCGQSLWKVTCGQSHVDTHLG